MRVDARCSSAAEANRLRAEDLQGASSIVESPSERTYLSAGDEVFLGIGEGDEVVTTPFTFIATANCALFERATPVFVDIDPESYNMDPAAAEAAMRRLLAGHADAGPGSDHVVPAPREH